MSSPEALQPGCSFQPFSDLPVCPASPALDFLWLSFKQQWKTVFSVSGLQPSLLLGFFHLMLGTTYAFISK